MRRDAMTKRRVAAAIARGGVSVLLLSASVGCGGSDGDPPVASPTPSPRPSTPTPAASGSPSPTATASPFPAVTFLTSDPEESDYWPRWSPDGDTVLFSREDASGAGRYALWTVPAAGGEAELLPGIPSTLGATRASWSWSTDRIAFSGSPSADLFRTYVVPGGGGDPEVIDAPNLGTIVNYPSWYPDGTALAVVDYGSTPGAPAGTLKRIAADGSSTTVLTDLAEIYAGEPAVSPDGATIAFPGQPNDGAPYDQQDNRIYLLPADGTPAVFDPDQGRTPDWSPDGAYLTFESTRACSGGRYAIWIEPLAGGDAIQVTDCALDGNHAVWSPDGSRIAFSAALAGSTGGRGVAVFEVPPLP
jgi:Tol biopolymer transport system component